MTARFEMWILLKIIALGELAVSALMFYLMWSEIHNMARTVPIIVYACVALALLFFANRSIRGAHKCYTGFYKPKHD